MKEKTSLKRMNEMAERFSRHTGYPLEFIHEDGTTYLEFRIKKPHQKGGQPHTVVQLIGEHVLSLKEVYGRIRHIGADAQDIEEIIEYLKPYADWLQ